MHRQLAGGMLTKRKNPTSLTLNQHAHSHTRTPAHTHSDADWQTCPNRRRCTDTRTHTQRDGRIRMRMRIRLWHFRFNLALHRFWSLVFRAAAAGSMERVETGRNGQKRSETNLKPKWTKWPLCHLPFLHFNCMLRPKVCNLSSSSLYVCDCLSFLPCVCVCYST